MQFAGVRWVDQYGSLIFDELLMGELVLGGAVGDPTVSISPYRHEWRLCSTYAPTLKETMSYKLRKKRLTS